MPRKKSRRQGPEATADPVSPPSPTPAASLSGEPTTKKSYRYPFEKDRAAKRVLTVREAEVVGYVAKGKQYHSIAQELGVRECTIQKHMENILAKLEAESRTEVAAWYYERELRAFAARNAALQTENEALKKRLRELGSRPPR